MIETKILHYTWSGLSTKGLLFVSHYKVMMNWEMDLNVKDVCVSEDARRTVVTLIMSTVYNETAEEMAKESNRQLK